MRGLPCGGSASLALVLVVGCGALDAGGPEERPPEKVSDTFSAGIRLPSIDGLDLTKVGPPDDGPAGAEQWLRKITVRVPAEGEARVMDVREASRWRGIALPRDEGGPQPIPTRVEDPPEVCVRVAADGAIRLGRLEVASPRELRGKLEELIARSPDLRLVFDAEGKAPWGKVMEVAAVALDAKPDLLFQAPPASPDAGGWWWEGAPPGPGGLAGPVSRLREEARRAGRDGRGLPNVCVGIRADAEAPYGAVQGVVVAAMRAYLWRLSFVGTLDGREVEIGVAYDSPDDPPARPPVLVSGTGVVGNLGIGGGPGVFGFRAGGGRRRAALRGGGSRSSESVVEAAHAWLARNQEPDGRWPSAKLGGAEGMDVAVTGLATLSLLGAGQTERTGRHRETVQKAVAWLVSNQNDNGCLADNAAKAAGRVGTCHAIAGLALAEAFGMARVGATGEAAQKAVTYSIDAHQQVYSGWGEEPKGDPDTLVTGWFTAQLKYAKIEGLRVDGRGFTGSISWLDKVSDMPGGAARVRSGEEPSPAATAVATFALQLMGWKRDDARVTGGANIVLAHLPEAGAKELDHELLYWGTLVMFQMGGERWNAWNARVRDMLIESQRTGTGDPALDGSWDPEGAAAGSLGRELGRAGATALAAMCLEVYYRYRPLYK